MRRKRIGYGKAKVEDYCLVAATIVLCSMIGNIIARLCQSGFNFSSFYLLISACALFAFRLTDIMDAHIRVFKWK